VNITQEPWFPGAVTGSLALFGVVFVALLSTWRDRRKERDATRTPTPPTTQQVWERLDKMERVVQASVAILGEVADQWPHDHVPVLSKRHVAVLMEAGYMPAEWEPETE
jgi:hypothetical protein